jgi:hypothetical protein
VYAGQKKHDPDPRYVRLYSYYLDMAPEAFSVYSRWKTHQGFKGSRLHAIERDEKGRIEDIPDGIIFPILAALSVFVEQTPEGWRIVIPAAFREDELIRAAVTAYIDTAKSNPSTMGKSKACYSQLYQITSIYKRLLSA